MKTFEEIEQNIIDAQIKHADTISEYAKKITEAQKELEEANAEMIEAERVVNADSYNNAKNKIVKANNTIELYKKHKKKLEEYALPNKKELVKEVIQLADANNEMYEKEAEQLYDRLVSLSKQAKHSFQEANGLLSILNGLPKDYTLKHSWFYGAESSLWKVKESIKEKMDLNSFKR